MQCGLLNLVCFMKNIAVSSLSLSTILLSHVYHVLLYQQSITNHSFIIFQGKREDHLLHQ